MDSWGMFGDTRGTANLVPSLDVGDGWKRWCIWGTHRGQAALAVIKEAPIKRCPGP